MLLLFTNKYSSAHKLPFLIFRVPSKIEIKRCKKNSNGKDKGKGIKKRTKKRFGWIPFIGFFH